MSIDVSTSNISSMSDADKRDLQQFILNESQKSNIQDTIHTLTAICFRKCVTSAIKDGKLDKYEQPCIQNCVGRFMDTTNVTIRHLERMRTQGQV